MNKQERKQQAIIHVRDLGFYNNVNEKDPIVKLIQDDDQECMVYHVSTGTYQLGGDQVEMTSYLIITSEDIATQDDLDNFKGNVSDGYHFSFTINHTWNIQEYGDVYLTKINGVWKRQG